MSDNEFIDKMHQVYLNQNLHETVPSNTDIKYSVLNIW